VTAVTIQPTLDAPDPVRLRPRPVPPRPNPPSCVLCPARPTTPFGLCRECLAAAAAEYARLSQRPAPDDSRPSSVHVSDLCGRCGSWKHLRAECDA
jgi:hypothetical protein